jgi:hypothetical protein
MWAYEMPSPSENEAKIMSQEQIRFYGTSKAYRARWDKVKIERTSLYADLLEAEAIWGNELMNLFKKVFDLEHELFTRIRHYIELINPDADVASKEAIRNIDKKKRDIMYDNLSEEPDEYKQELISAIEDIEKYLKPKLRHEKVYQLRQCGLPKVAPLRSATLGIRLREALGGGIAVASLTPGGWSCA